MKYFWATFCLKENVTAPSGYPTRIFPISRVENSSDTTGHIRARGFWASHKFGILKGVNDSRSRSYATTSPEVKVNISGYAIKEHHSGNPHTIRQPDKSVVETGIRGNSRGLTRRRIRSHQGPSLKRIDADLILRVDADELMGTELEELGRGLARELQNHQDAPLSEHIDLAAAKLGIAGADSEERLNGIVCDGTNLGIHTTSRKLITTESVHDHKKRMPGMPRRTSSSWKSSGDRPSDKSFWIPACLPRRN